MNRILIAEDEERIAAFIEKGLRANGFIPTVVADGDSALDMARWGGGGSNSWCSISGCPAGTVSPCCACCGKHGCGHP